jgi:hypothetical protein
MEVDNWIKVLLDEAENERMHLMTFICIKKVTTIEKLVILLTQGVFFYAYLFFYLFFPKTAHRFVGYLEVHQVAIKRGRERERKREREREKRKREREREKSKNNLQCEVEFD